MNGRKLLAISLIIAATLLTPAVPVTRLREDVSVEREELLFTFTPYTILEELESSGYTRYEGPPLLGLSDGTVGTYAFIDVRGKYNATVEGYVRVESDAPYVLTFDLYVLSVSQVLGRRVKEGNIRDDVKRALIVWGWYTSEVEPPPHVTPPKPVFKLEGAKTGAPVTQKVYRFRFTVNETDCFIFLLSPRDKVLNLENATIVATLRYYAPAEDVELVSLARLLYELAAAWWANSPPRLPLRLWGLATSAKSH